jgi:hypothetical protein
MPLWNPVAWTEKTSDDRVRDFVLWERDTIQPKYAVPYGLQYTLTYGVAELYDYEWFFGGFMRHPEPELVKGLGIDPATDIVAYPRRGFDMWNTRYFVLPYYPGNWTDQNRGYASFLENSEQIYPTPEMFKGPGGRERELAYVKEQDFLIRRNLSYMPRAWVVHAARAIPTIRGLDREDRDKPMQEILFMNDLTWRDSTRVAYDPRQVAWVDQGEISGLAPYLPGGPPGAGESVEVVKYEPDRVELDVTLSRPGLVVLADVYYPGWTLTIDGKPAPVYRANRLMRGAAVPSDRHRLVFTYRPHSFRAGLAVSVGGVLALAAFSLFAAFRPGSPALAPDAQEDRR